MNETKLFEIEKLVEKERIDEAQFELSKLGTEFHKNSLYLYLRSKIFFKNKKTLFILRKCFFISRF